MSVVPAFERLRPTDRTTTNKATQLVLILTACSFCRPNKVVG